MLKLIPQEFSQEENKSQDKNKPQRENKTKHPENKRVDDKLRLDIIQQCREEKKILSALGLKLLDFGKRAETYSAEQVGELIHGLQRSVLALQRKRLRMLSSKNKRKNKKNK